MIGCCEAIRSADLNSWRCVGDKTYLEESIVSGRKKRELCEIGLTILEYSFSNTCSFSRAYHF